LSSLFFKKKTFNQGMPPTGHINKKARFATKKAKIGKKSRLNRHIVEYNWSKIMN